MAGGNGDRGEDEAWNGAEEALEPTEQLPLSDDGDRLPWLESADDEFDDENYGSGTGRLLMFALAGLLALLAIVGGLWWLNREDNGTTVADGGVIKAPAQAYKEVPENPGGKTFDGTGDSSFVVSEGQNRPGRLDTGSAEVPAAATPSASPAPTQLPKAGAVPAPAPKASPTSAPSPAQSSGIGVQVGAYSSQAGAEAGWNRLASAHSELLSGVKHRVVAGKADIGTVYRLQALAGDTAGANALCAKLKAAGVACQVK